MIRILLVDDQSLIRRGLRALLKTDPELEIVGEAEQGQAAITLTATLQPDVVLMDVRMPLLDGVEATRLICQQFLQTKVLILTTFDDREYVTQALQAGAAGYLLKDTPFEELVQAIRLANKGYTQLSPGLASKALAQAPPSAFLTVSAAWQKLTPREQEIIEAISQGASNREIAETLFIAEKTVKNRVTSILSKLHLRDRTQLAIVALQKGISDSYDVDNI
jgi:DNA-binding NarL/FixJ family response regulator